MKNNHLRIAPATDRPNIASTGPRFSPKTEETIEWFRVQIITLSNRNARLWKEMAFYRTACCVLTTIILVELAGVFIALLWSLS